jgi:hypothetical protein
MRISEFSDPILFSSQISPDDVAQGRIGNCYFLAVCSSLAEQPSQVHDRFITKSYNKAGIYLLNFWINGQQTPVLVDDYLPIEGNKLIFSHSKQGDFWVCLLEKAWAKLMGSYGATIQG